MYISLGAEVHLFPEASVFALDSLRLIGCGPPSFSRWSYSMKGPRVVDSRPRPQNAFIITRKLRCPQTPSPAGTQSEPSPPNLGAGKNKTVAPRASLWSEKAPLSRVPPRLRRLHSYTVFLRKDLEATGPSSYTGDNVSRSLSGLKRFLQPQRLSRGPGRGSWTWRRLCVNLRGQIVCVCARSLHPMLRNERP